MNKSDELRELMLRSHEAFTNGDHAFHSETMSQQDGVLAIGSDPSEWWEGYETITKVFKAQMKEMSGFSVVGADPIAYSEGTVGWGVDRYTLRFPDGTEVSFRETKVFHQENGKWKVVQFHGSIGVLNEEVIGKELTV